MKKVVKIFTVLMLLALASLTVWVLQGPQTNIVTLKAHLGDELSQRKMVQRYTLGDELNTKKASYWLAKVDPLPGELEDPEVKRVMDKLEKAYGKPLY